MRLTHKQNWRQVMQRIGMGWHGLAVLAVLGLGACADAPSSPSSDPAAAAVGADNVGPAIVVGTEAASIRLRCERRGSRSKISVDGRGLTPRTGRFRARVTAAGGTATSPLERAVAGEAEFDFDSNPNDVAAGATRIAATFIRAQAGPDVTTRILNASGQVVATQNAECSFR
jgi:hypothetical protein